MNNQPMRQVAEDAATSNRGQQALAIEEIFPPHDFGSWPEGFAASREQIYGDDGAMPPPKRCPTIRAPT